MREVVEDAEEDPGHSTIERRGSESSESFSLPPIVRKFRNFVYNILFYSKTVLNGSNSQIGGSTDPKRSLQCREETSFLAK